MPGADSTSISTLVRPIVEDIPSIVMYTNNSLLPALKSLGMTEERAGGDSAYRWKVVRGTGNSSVELYVEGQALLASGSQSWVEAALPWVYHRVRVQLTGHARDYVQSHYLADAWLGQLAGEVKYGIDNMTDLLTNTLLGTGSNGIQLAVDSTGTYAALSRATFADWGSRETAAGGALTTALMTAEVEALRDNDIANAGTRFEATILPLNQLTNYVALAGPENSTVAARLVRYVATPGQGPHVDVGWDDTGVTFMGKPVVGVGDMLDTIILFVCNIADDWFLRHIRPMEIKQLALTDDSAADMQISIGCAFGCRNPRRQSKLTGVTA